jgi:pyrrolidone-carboxylate peptidase
MSEVWDTKDGRRRVRRDPPTVEDAALAAQGLTEDLEGQIEIVVALMPVSAEEARRALLKTRRSRDDSLLTITGRAGGSRSVVVERKARRAIQSRASQPRASGGRQGLG